MLFRSGTGALTNNGSGAFSWTSLGTWAGVNYPIWTSGTPFVKMTAAGAFALDTNIYLTGTGVTGATKTKITYNSDGLVTSATDATTTDISEGSNLYYTNARADARISAAIGVTVQAYNANTTILGNATTGSGSIVLATAPTLSNPIVGTQTKTDNSTKAASTAFVQNQMLLYLGIDTAFRLSIVY
mgnify:CR=1 FL=1